MNSWTFQAPCSPLCRWKCWAGIIPAFLHSLPFSAYGAARFDRPPTKHGVTWSCSASCLALQQGTQILWDSVFSSSESRNSLNFKSQWKLQTFSNISFPHEEKPHFHRDPNPLVKMQRQYSDTFPFLDASKTLEKYLYKYRNSALILRSQAFATDSHSYLTVCRVLVSIMWGLARCTRSLHLANMTLC